MFSFVSSGGASEQWGEADHGSNDGKMYAATRPLIVENKIIYSKI